MTVVVSIPGTRNGSELRESHLLVPLNIVRIRQTVEHAGLYRMLNWREDMMRMQYKLLRHLPGELKT
jgi:hypothetical protein